MTDAEVIEEWRRRRRRLQVMHTVFLVVVAGGLLAAYQLMPAAVAEFIESWSLALAMGALALYVALWATLCKCPNCGRYPGGKPRIDPQFRTRGFRRGPFDYTFCAHCGKALVRS